MANRKTYVVSVKDKNYCGIGAGGAQFARGEALIDNERMAAWFREHEGYTVKEITTADDEASGGSAATADDEASGGSAATAKSGTAKRGKSPASK